MVAQFDAVQECTNAFRKLFQGRNWLLGAPMMAGQLLAVFVSLIVVFAAMGPVIVKQILTNSENPELSPLQIGIFVVGITIAILVAIAINAFVYGWTLAAADPVWAGNDPAFDRGFNRAAQTLLQLIAFQLLVGLMAIVSIITIVGPIVIGVLAMYGPAYIVLGGRSSTRAIADSFKLASENLSETVILVLAYIVIVIGAIIPVVILSLIPFVGYIVQIAFQALFSAYVALTLVRFYELLNARAGTPPIPIVPKTSV